MRVMTRSAFESMSTSRSDRAAPKSANDGSDPSPQLPKGQLLKEVKPSTISTAQLHRLPDFHMPPIKQVIFLRSYPVDPVGNLISRRASHLDAFSAYPDRT